MSRGDQPTPSQYASLRGFVPHRPRERTSEQPAHDHRISVADWLIGIGRVIARRAKIVPGSPVARIHARR
jgi:hypothetical protein